MSNRRKRSGAKQERGALHKGRIPRNPSHPGSQQPSSSWQPTINRFFGGKGVPVQPTLMQCLRKEQRCSSKASDVHGSGEGNSSTPVTSDAGMSSTPAEGVRVGGGKVAGYETTRVRGGGGEVADNKMTQVRGGGGEVAGDKTTGVRGGQGEVAGDKTTGVRCGREEVTTDEMTRVSGGGRMVAGDKTIHVRGEGGEMADDEMTRVRGGWGEVSGDKTTRVSGGGGEVARDKTNRVRCREGEVAGDKMTRPSNPFAVNCSRAGGTANPRKSLSLKSHRSKPPVPPQLTTPRPLFSDLSMDDEVLLAGYTGAPLPPPRPSLRDLEEGEGGRSLKRSRAASLFSPNKVPKKHHPSSPSFSPRVLHPRQQNQPSHPRWGAGVTPSPLSITPSPLTGTPPLFTPSPASVTLAPSCSTTSKRILFPPATDTSAPSPTGPHTLTHTLGPATHPPTSPSLPPDSYSFTGDFDFSLASATLSPPLQPAGAQMTRLARLHRRLVLECTSQESASGCPELRLRLLGSGNSEETVCFLRDEWLDSDFYAGDMVQLNFPSHPHPSTIIIDNASESSVVLEPDTLISGTTIATSIVCPRRSVLSERMRGCGGEGEAMAIGKLSHEVFQEVLCRWKEHGIPITMATVTECVQNVMAKMESLEQLYSLGLSEVHVQGRLEERAPAIVEWCQRFLRATPQRPQGDIEFKRSASDPDGRYCAAVSEIVDIEENIWSPRYGLKGKVDVTVRLEGVRGEGPRESFVAPLELKTGKMFRAQGSTEHRAQVALYCLMLEEKLRCQATPPTPPPAPGGLLFYLQTGHLQGLPLLPHEKRGLLIARNRLARYLGSVATPTLPEMLRDRHTCQYCPLLRQCLLHHKAIEDGTEETSGVGSLFNDHTHTLSPSHMQFYAKWYRLLLTEQAHCNVRGRGGVGRLWGADAEQREKEGHCLSHMIALTPSPSTPSLLTKDMWQQPFQREQQRKPCQSEPPLAINDRVVISRQDGSGWAITMGTICSASSWERVIVSTDKPVPAHGLVYRVDAAPSPTSLPSLSTLTKLCSSDSERDFRLRELIIDLCPPRFSPDTTPPSELGGPSLNEGQRAAIAAILRARDYALLLGPPGTGKTTTIAALVQLLVARQHSVLLSSYTHSAVDSILLKLKEIGVDFIRLGSPHRVHPSLLPHTPSRLLTHPCSLQQLEHLYNSKLVVAATCLGADHRLFARRAFDYCIVDEASQVTLPACLAPLRHAAVFVLAGDHYQLPPLVQSPAARVGGLDESLFRRLSRAHPSALAALSQQYRMNREIMALANSLIYGGRLRCGCEGVASARLALPRLSELALPDWLQRCLSPHQPVVFLDTDQCANRGELRQGDGVSNLCEAHLLATITQALLQAGLPGADIGVVTLYHQQQQLVRETLAVPSATPTLEDTTMPTSEVEVSTVDRYQGRDKCCLLLSLVRSNHRGAIGGLLLDWRRLNVALTRAQHKLVLVGSSSTLCHAPLLSCLLTSAREEGWLVSMPAPTV